MKQLIYILMLVSFACSGSGQEVSENIDGVTLSGTVGFPQEGQIILERIEGNNSAVQIATIPLNENYTYKYVFETKIPGYYRLNFYNKQIVVFILDQDDMIINVDGNSRSGFMEIKGSKDHDLILRVQQLKQALQSGQEFADINRKFQEASRIGDTKTIESLRSEYMELERRNSTAIAEAIREMKNSLAAFELLRSRIVDMDTYFELYEEVSNSLKQRFPDLAMVSEFSVSVENMKRLAIGSIAPEIELPNPDGEMVKLSSFRGNYVLVDFWAKWCKPCRMENPNIVRNYNRYNEKGFEILGVSLDRNRADWLQAIEEDNLVWTHVSDLKYWNSVAAKTYNVTGIPFAVLLDPEGRIIAKNLRGSALDNKLAEIYD